jgi:hypothetical protein
MSIIGFRRTRPVEALPTLVVAPQSRDLVGELWTSYVAARQDRDLRYVAELDQALALLNPIRSRRDVGPAFEMLLSLRQNLHRAARAGEGR